MNGSKFILAALFLFSLSSFAGQVSVFSRGGGNYMIDRGGNAKYLGVACNDFFSEGAGGVVVYRNCETNWAASESIGGAKKLGKSCDDFRGRLAGSIVVYQNCGENWTLDAKGDYRRLGTGCPDFEILSAGRQKIAYANCGRVWQVDDQGNVSPAK